MSAHRRILCLVLFAALLALTGCGVSLEGAAESGEAGPLERRTAEVSSESREENGSSLPPRPPGTVRIEGQAQGSLTETLLAAYEERGSSVEFEVSPSREEEAFGAFCEGEADIVDSARPISPMEYALCQANGVEPVQIEIAADAAVLAIANETDVGVDCLSVEDVREIFRAASPITSWAQVGWGGRSDPSVDALPIKVAGPDARSNVIGFFGQFVLGDDDPSLLLLRGDYQAFPNDKGVRLAVSGNREQLEQAAQSQSSQQVAADLAEALADAEAAVAVAEHEIEKGIEDNRSEAARANDADRLSEAEDKVAEIGAELEQAKDQSRVDDIAAAEIAQRLGTLGLIRYSYYELWEERLRPMEVQAIDAEGNPECIFPSQSTVTDATYPLARQLLLTVDLNTMKEAEINEFLSFAVAGSRQLAIEKALVPLPDEVRNTELAWLNGEIAPDVVYYPPARIVADEKEEAAERTGSG
ncbi:MAG TPA: substrate-binding domain-containing protein [Solirubrobacterales bacterium]